MYYAAETGLIFVYHCTQVIQDGKTMYSRYVITYYKTLYIPWTYMKRADHRYGILSYAQPTL